LIFDKSHKFGISGVAAWWVKLKGVNLSVENVIGLDVPQPSFNDHLSDG
jgi:hypothetical protein